MSESFQNFNHLIKIYIQCTIQNPQTSKQFCCLLYIYQLPYVHVVQSPVGPLPYGPTVQLQRGNCSMIPTTFLTLHCHYVYLVAIQRLTLRSCDPSKKLLKTFSSRRHHLGTIFHYMSALPTEKAQILVKTALAFLLGQLAIFPKLGREVGVGFLQVGIARVDIPGGV